jgi:hypothetical protein
VIYLIGEILALLLAAALIGAAMAWGLRGLRALARERRMVSEMNALRAARDAAEAEARSRKAQLEALGEEMERQARGFQARIAALEARLQKPPPATGAPAAAAGIMDRCRRLAASLYDRTVGRLRS